MGVCESICVCERERERDRDRDREVVRGILVLALGVKGANSLEVRKAHIVKIFISLIYLVKFSYM